MPNMLSSLRNDLSVGVGSIRSDLGTRTDVFLDGWTQQRLDLGLNSAAATLAARCSSRRSRRSDLHRQAASSLVLHRFADAAIPIPLQSCAGRRGAAIAAGPKCPSCLR